MHVTHSNIILTYYNVAWKKHLSSTIFLQPFKHQLICTGLHHCTLFLANWLIGTAVMTCECRDLDLQIAMWYGVFQWIGVNDSRYGCFQKEWYPQKSSILIGFSIRNHPFWVPYFWKHPFICCYRVNTSSDWIFQLKVSCRIGSSSIGSSSAN